MGFSIKLHEEPLEISIDIYCFYCRTEAQVWNANAKTLKLEHSAGM